MKKVIAFLGFSFILSFLFSQDIIITNENDTIGCNIKSMDSLTISYVPHFQTAETWISKSDIKTYVKDFGHYTNKNIDINSVSEDLNIGTKGKDRLLLKSNEIIICKIIEVNESTLIYKIGDEIISIKLNDVSDFIIKNYNKKRKKIKTELNPVITKEGSEYLDFITVYHSIRFKTYTNMMENNSICLNIINTEKDEVVATISVGDKISETSSVSGITELDLFIIYKDNNDYNELKIKINEMQYISFKGTTWNKEQTEKFLLSAITSYPNIGMAFYSLEYNTVDLKEGTYKIEVIKNCNK